MLTTQPMKQLAVHTSLALGFIDLAIQGLEKGSYAYNKLNAANEAIKKAIDDMLPAAFQGPDIEKAGHLIDKFEAMVLKAYPGPKVRKPRQRRVEA